MYTMESRRPTSMQLDSHMNPENSAQFVRNLNKMDQSVKKMLNLIEDGENLREEEKAELYYQKKSELIAYAAEFNDMYQSVAESLGGKLLHTDSSSEIKRCGSSESVPEHAFSSPTPSPKPGPQKTAEVVDYDSLLSSGGGSSDLSLKEGSESSLLSSFDSESRGSFNSNNSSGAHTNGDGKLLPRNIIGELGLHSMNEEPQVAKEDEEYFVFEPRRNLSYDELLGRIAEYDKKLRVSDQKLKISEEEVGKLKVKLEESESVFVHAGHVQAVAPQDMMVESETRIPGSPYEKQEQISELEINKEMLLSSDDESAKLLRKCGEENSKDAHQFEGQLDIAWNTINMLVPGLDSERCRVSDLQKKIAECITDISTRDCEIEELKFARNEDKERFSLEKARLQSAVADMMEQQNQTEAKLASREDEIERYRSQSIETKRSHEVQEAGLRHQIERVKEENAERGELIEVLNKDLDVQKLKYDMLMAEKDDYVAQVLKLIAELTSRDIRIQQMEQQLLALRTEREDLNAGYDSTRNLVHGLRSRVEELEKEVDRQGAVIRDGEEKKREAIRQLCFALEHYRSGYQELRQAFVGPKSRAVFAS